MPRDAGGVDRRCWSGRCRAEPGRRSGRATGRAADPCAGLQPAATLSRDSPDRAQWVERRSVRTDERLGECRYGAWTGGSLKELAKEPLWRTVQDQPSAARFPMERGSSGSPIAEMQARGLQAVRDTDAAVNDEHGPGAIWALVSHGDIIKSIWPTRPARIWITSRGSSWVRRRCRS